MNNLINHLQAINLDEVKLKPFENLPYSESETSAIESINSDSEMYLETKPVQLASIMSAVQVALQDEKVGSFDRNDMIAIAYFMESELKTLDKVIGIKSETDHHLDAIKQGKIND